MKKQKTHLKAENSRLFEVYMVDIAKLWDRTPTGQITMNTAIYKVQPYQIFEDFMKWKKRNDKNKVI